MVEVGGCWIWTIGRMREKSASHCCSWSFVRRPVCSLALLCTDWCAVQSGIVVRRPVCSLALLCSRRTWFIFMFGRTLQIHCFNFFNVCTYHSELFVAPLFMNSTNKIPSLSQKTLAMTLPAQVHTLNLLPSFPLQSKFSTLRLASIWPPEECTPRMLFWGWQQAETKHAWIALTIQQSVLCNWHTVSHAKV
jgi:hypothetical protein